MRLRMLRPCAQPAELQPRFWLCGHAGVSRSGSSSLGGGRRRALSIVTFHRRSASVKFRCQRRLNCQKAAPLRLIRPPKTGLHMFLSKSGVVRESNATFLSSTDALWCDPTWALPLLGACLVQ